MTNDVKEHVEEPRVSAHVTGFELRHTLIWPLICGNLYLAARKCSLDVQFA